MGVNYSRVPFSGDGAQLSRGPNVPLAAQRESISGQAGVLGAADEGRAGRRDDEGSIAEVAQTGREQEDLPLAATPAAPGVDVKYPGQVHYASSFRANARNSPRSHGSDEAVISSGCHWTPIAHQFRSVDSIPSMTPSDARAVIRMPAATSFTD